MRFHFASDRHFEQAGVPCINGSLPIEIVKDKLRSSQILSRAGVPIPNTMMVRMPIDDKLVENNIGVPCVVKVVTGSYGEGVYLCETEKSFKFYIESLKSLKVEKLLLAQKYIDFSSLK